jgi:hypothetical protein
VEEYGNCKSSNSVYPLHGGVPSRIVCPDRPKKKVLIEIENAFARLNAEHLFRYTQGSKP